MIIHTCQKPALLFAGKHILSPELHCVAKMAPFF